METLVSCLRNDSFLIAELRGNCNEVIIRSEALNLHSQRKHQIVGSAVHVIMVAVMRAAGKVTVRERYIPFFAGKINQFDAHHRQAGMTFVALYAESIRVDRTQVYVRIVAFPGKNMVVLHIQQKCPMLVVSQTRKGFYTITASHVVIAFIETKIV